MKLRSRQQMTKNQAAKIITKQALMSLYDPIYKLTKQRLFKNVTIHKNGSITFNANSVSKLFKKPTQTLPKPLRVRHDYSRTIDNHLNLNKQSLIHGFEQLNENNKLKFARRSRFPRLLTNELERRSMIQKKLHSVKDKVHNESNANLKRKIQHHINMIEKNEKLKNKVYNEMVKDLSPVHTGIVARPYANQSNLLAKYNKYARQSAVNQTRFDDINIYMNTGNLNKANQLRKRISNRISYK